MNLKTIVLLEMIILIWKTKKIFYEVGYQKKLQKQYMIIQIRINK